MKIDAKMIWYDQHMDENYPDWDVCNYDLLSHPTRDIKGVLVRNRNSFNYSLFCNKSFISVPYSWAYKEDVLFRDELKQLRLASGLSQSEAATMLGISVRSLQNWEQHRSSCASLIKKSIVEQYWRIIKEKKTDFTNDVSLVLKGSLYDLLDADVDDNVVKTVDEWIRLADMPSVDWGSDKGKYKSVLKEYLDRYYSNK